MIEYRDGGEGTSERQGDTTTNFMDFSDCEIANNYPLPRPILSAARKESYESQAHCSQALQEMHR